MKICPTCQAANEDNAAFCAKCGTNLSEVTPVPGAVTYQAQDPYDHTAEFDSKDISDYKVFAMLPYLMGVVGIFIALLAAQKSEYAMFHVRQALKFQVVNILLLLCSAILCWTFLVPIAAGVCMCIVFVLEIIAFFQVCKGKAKEPAIIKKLGFLR